MPPQLREGLSRSSTSSVPVGNAGGYPTNFTVNETGRVRLRIANREAARPVLVDGARMQGCKLTEIIDEVELRESPSRSCGGIQHGGPRISTRPIDVAPSGSHEYCRQAVIVDLVES